MNNINPSKEQLNFINAVKEGNNVQGDAVAGSGKTTTVLFMAHEINNKKILQITYNSDLKTEVREKKKKLQEIMNLDNLEIQNYHSFGTTYYTDEAKTDIGLEKIIKKNMKPQRELPIIDILVIDEIQDMNELYYRFLLKIIKDSNNFENIQIVTLGDKYQGLYEFKGSDTRYLTLSPNIFGFSLRPFKIIELNTSYRITREIARFINDGMLGYNRLNAVKNGQPVLYIKYDPYQGYKMIGHKLINLINVEKVLKPDEVFVTSPSVKSDRYRYVKLLENMLVSNGIPCFVPTSESSKVNTETIKNKVVFSSFHQTKGRERKVCIVFGFDDDYFKIFRDYDPEFCPSTFYVATTRATETLILVEGAKQLPFLNYTHKTMMSSDHVEFLGNPLGLQIESNNDNRPSTPEYNTTPTDLISFLDEKVLYSIVELIEQEELYELNEKSDFGIEVNIPSSIKEQRYYEYNLTEEVSDLNGLVIPAIFEERTSRKKTSAIREKVKLRISKLSDKHIYNKLLVDIDFSSDKLSISDYLKVGNIFNSITESLDFKIRQIEKTKYDWLKEENVEMIIRNIHLHISQESAESMIYEDVIITTDDKNFEYKLIDQFTKSINIRKKIRFNARVDALNEEDIWEFKCTDILEPEHFIQLIIYAWLWNMTCVEERGTRTFKIINIRTGEMYRLNYKKTIINKIMELLFTSKYQVRKYKTDEEFINHHQELYRSLFLDI
jgi:hypothetical protein